MHFLPRWIGIDGILNHGAVITPSSCHSRNILCCWEISPPCIFNFRSRATLPALKFNHCIGNSIAWGETAVLWGLNTSIHFKSYDVLIHFFLEKNLLSILIPSSISVYTQLLSVTLHFSIHLIFSWKMILPQTLVPPIGCLITFESSEPSREQPFEHTVSRFSSIFYSGLGINAFF